MAKQQKSLPDKGKKVGTSRQRVAQYLPGVGLVLCYANARIQRTLAVQRRAAERSDRMIVKAELLSRVKPKIESQVQNLEMWNCHFNKYVDEHSGDEADPSGELVEVSSEKVISHHVRAS